MKENPRATRQGIMQREPTPFRCGGCGYVRELDAERGWITFSRGRGREGPACVRCGPTRWVRVGSTTEFYDFWARDDVCRVGEHVAQRVTSHRIQRGKLVVFVNVCPQHLDSLRSGWHGWTLLT